MKIFLLCLSVVSVWGFIWVMRYNLHMFQLNGYKNMEHIGWLRKNFHKQRLLYVVFLLGIMSMVIDSVLTEIALFVVYLILIKYYGFLRKNNTKKKLVYTKRVKRLIITNVILNSLIIIICSFSLGWNTIVRTTSVLIFALPFMLLGVNIINKPLEQIISNYYVKDAQRKLEDVPHLQVLGVTGSYGKTSLKYYLETLLKEKYNVLITPESYNTPMGVVKTIRESLRTTHEVFICEMGARHVGDIKEICDIVHPKHGVITSIGPQHLETFYNMDNIVSTKFELADALPEDGKLFLNGDNLYLNSNGQKYPNRIFYNTDKNEGYYAKDIRLSQSGTEFEVVSPRGEREKFQTRLIGGHNVINIVGAISVANSMGIAMRDLKAPVRRIQPVEHRMQMLEKGNVTIIDDAYNSNPVGSKAALETLAMFEGLRILITPGMVELGEKEEEYNYKFGTYAARCCDYILLIGRKHTKPIEKGILDTGFQKEKCIVYDKLDDALAYAYSIKSEDHKYILLENDLPDNY